VNCRGCKRLASKRLPSCRPNSSQSTNYISREAEEERRLEEEERRLVLWVASRPPVQGLRVALPARRLRAKASSYQPPHPRDD